MKSKASIKGHPLHPILVTFPIAFFTGALLSDIAGVVLDRGDFNSFAFYLIAAGIVFGLLAAIPGIIDFRYTVPPKSSAKKRAAKHGLINSFAILLFIAVLFIRRNSDTSILLLIAIELVGVILLGIAGWLGGTLVFRNQIGVDIRYANAGKWNEEYVNESETPVILATTNEVQLNQMKLVHIGDQRIVLCKTETGYHAFDDWCTHRGASLAAGSLICGTVQCPWHGSQFDVLNGKVKAGPAKESIKTYEVHEKDGKLILGSQKKIE